MDSKKQFGIINLYDGEYNTMLKSRDEWIVLIDRPLEQIDATGIESQLVVEYTKNKRMNIRKRLTELLKEKGYQELDAICENFDYTGYTRSY